MNIVLAFYTFRDSNAFIGPEVVEQALQILDVVSKATPDLQLDISSHLFGGCAIDATGIPLPDETLAACKAADAVLMGQ